MYKCRTATQQWIWCLSDDDAKMHKNATSFAYNGLAGGYRPVTYIFRKERSRQADVKL